MRKFILLSMASLLASGTALAQTANDAYNLSQTNDIKGTARFMSMGGAFGALGGDLSTLTQNPAGIGVYRSNEIGITFDLDFQGATAKSNGFSEKDKQTKFYLNNFGGVATWKFDTSVLRNLNIGFTYNKVASFDTRYKGVLPGLNTSMSNYIAGINNAEGVTVGDVETVPGYDPYNPNDGGYETPWLSILGYDGWLTSPYESNGETKWNGLFNSNTSGTGYFETEIKGGVDQYNISVGGNFNDKIFWGMTFGITDIRYRAKTSYGEALDNAQVDGVNTRALWGLFNSYDVSGTGFNYSLGVIWKPIQELRVGFSFHTPTWYRLSQTYYGAIPYYSYPDTNLADLTDPIYTDNGYDATNDFRLRTPWKIIASVAGVFFNKLILSFDYEWQGWKNMRLSDPKYSWYDDYYWDYDYSYDYITAPGTSGNSYRYENQDIKDFFKSTHQIRLGAEYRINNHWSLRAGFSYVTSPSSSLLKSGTVHYLTTTDTRPEFTVDEDTYYLGCGAGYRFKWFYIDLAYLYKHRELQYRPFAADSGYANLCPKSDVSLSNNQVVLSFGVKF